MEYIILNNKDNRANDDGYVANCWLYTCQQLCNICPTWYPGGTCGGNLPEYSLQGFSGLNNY